MITQQDLEKQGAVISLIDALWQKNNWCGKTQVQKSAFFVEVLSGKKLDFDFVLYKHGPFSFSLADTLGTMDTLQYLKFEVPNPRYGPRLKPNQEAVTLLREKFGNLAKELEKVIEFVAEKLGDCGVVALERLATALYFTKQDPVEGEEARALKICEIKPHIEQRDATEAVRKVDVILAEWDAIQGAH